MANEKNLKPQSERTKSEQRRIAAAGGKASGVARRQKKAAKDVAALILAGKITDDRAEQELKQMGIEETDLTVQAALLASTAREGMRGNVKATEYLIGLSGDVDDSDSRYYGIPASLMGKAFVDIYRDILERTYRFFDFRGGRGSLKSSFCALILVDTIMLNQQMCGIAMREVADTMRESVYAQIIWAIEVLGLTDEFDCTVSPMKIVRKATGQVIYFRGGSEPDKIKSIKPPKGMYIGVAWYEEADQFRGTAAVRKINQSIMRGGDDFVFLRSYNTPISQRHFINLEAREDKSNRVVHHSHYTDSPIQWLGTAFYEEAEELKRINPRAFAHEYDGDATGTGLNVFENVVERVITDNELSTFDRLSYGIDWGWYPHPTAFVECYFSTSTRELYIYGEREWYKTRNEDLAAELDAYRNVPITADPGGGGDRSIADLNAWGFNVRTARKGPGSIEYGIKWLQSLTNIYIDPVRCPKAAEQFSLYEYLKDKDGNPITGYPDEGDDFIDAVRYAYEDYFNVRGN